MFKNGTESGHVVDEKPLYFAVGFRYHGFLQMDSRSETVEILWTGESRQNSLKRDANYIQGTDTALEKLTDLDELQNLVS